MKPPFVVPSRRLVLGALGLGALSAACRKRPELPVLGKVGNFALTDQAGRAVTAEALRGEVWAAAFMFTRCPTICPRITSRMRELQQAAAAKQIKVSLVSFSVDPEHDTPEVLRAYAKEHQADLSSWRFLTGDFEVVKQASVEGFKLALDGKAQPNADHFGILHGSHLVLVDGALQIRGYYRTSDEQELQKLLLDAASLA